MECKTCMFWGQIKDEDGLLPVMDGSDAEIGSRLCVAAMRTFEVVSKGKLRYACADNIR